MAISNRRRKELKRMREPVPETEHEKRLLFVQRLWLEGVPSREIQIKTAEHFHVTERCVRDWIPEMLADIKALEGEVDAVVYRAKARERLENLHRRALEQTPPDYRLALLVVDRTLKLLPDANQVQLTGTGGGPLEVKVTDDLTARVAAILERKNI